MNWALHYLETVVVAVLVGKIVLLSFVVAPILSKTLDAASFAKVVRTLFPSYYRFGAWVSLAGILAGSGLFAIGDKTSPWGLILSLWLAALLIELYCHYPLTPQINAVCDWITRQEKEGLVEEDLVATWKRLHQRSVWLNGVVLVIGLLLIALMLPST
jgi:hypothetical protein